MAPVSAFPDGQESRHDPGEQCAAGAAGPPATDGGPDPDEHRQEQKQIARRLPRPGLLGERGQLGHQRAPPGYDVERRRRRLRLEQLCFLGLVGLPKTAAHPLGGLPHPPCSEGHRHDDEEDERRDPDHHHAPACRFSGLKRSPGSSMPARSSRSLNLGLTPVARW